MRVNMHWTIAPLTVWLALSAAACGTEEEEIPTSDSGGDTSTDGGGDTGGDAGTDVSADASACEGPNPAGCNDDPCPPDLECLPTGDAACMPSSCSCGDDGVWVCTEDCGPSVACVPAVPDVCPEAMPEIGGACELSEGTTCGWGNECCCGGCFDSLQCMCSGGRWVCMATDACFIESCEGRPCDSESDCEGGVIGAIACVDGFCRSEFFCDRHETEEECNATGVCEFQVPGCASEPQVTIEAPGCFPARECTSDDECPSGSVCMPEVVVEPACARATGGAVCDACGQTRSLCVRER